jgi:hypothetical protein
MESADEDLKRVREIEPGFTIAPVGSETSIIVTYRQISRSDNNILCKLQAL